MSILFILIQHEYYSSICIKIDKFRGLLSKGELSNLSKRLIKTLGAL